MKFTKLILNEIWELGENSGYSLIDKKVVAISP